MAFNVNMILTKAYADTKDNQLVFEIGNHHAYLADLSAKYKPVEPSKVSIAAIKVSEIIRIPETPNLVPDISSDFLWPTTSRNITQKYRSGHTGVDISNGQKAEVYASASGSVESASYMGAYGNTIIIDHQNGYETQYSHLSQFKVQQGQAVAQGELIGYQGNTGRVRGKTGIHLHFEISKNGVNINPLGLVK